MLQAQFRAAVTGRSHLARSIKPVFSWLHQSRKLATAAARPTSGTNVANKSLARRHRGAQPAVQQEQELTQDELAALKEPAYSAQVVHGRGVANALTHPRTHGYPVALLHMRGYSARALDLFAHFALHAAAALGVPVSRRAIRLPARRSLWTVPKSPFAMKKAQENFERRVRARAVLAWDATPAVAERWVRYVLAHPQPGVGVRVVRWHRAPLGVGRGAGGMMAGRRMSEAMQETARLENVTSRGRVEEVAKRIVKREMEAAKAEPEKGGKATSSASKVRKMTAAKAKAQ